MPIALARCCAPLVAALVAACAPQAPASWSGYVEGEYVFVAPALPGMLVRLQVQRGQAVAAGDVLFALDVQAEQAGREESVARLQAARALAANAAKGRRADEIAVIEAQLAQAQTQSRLAESELARQQGLVAQGFISAARLDEAASVAAQARARVAELTAALRVARLPARADEQAAAVAQVQAASQVLAQSAWREEQKLRRAPLAARVAETYFREGEWVGAGQPVVALLPPAGVKARFFVPQADLGAIAVGQRVRLLCDGCGAAIEARISFIATHAEYTPPVIYSNAQRSKLVFMVEARPEGAGAERLKPGQPLDVLRADAGAKT